MSINNDHDRANEQKWDRRAVTFDDHYNDYFRIMQRELINLARLSPPCNFLDLGCGTGWAVRYAADLLNGQGTFAGIDISNGMIEKARQNAAERPDLKFYRASSEHLPFEPGYFDTIICTNSFHHYAQPVTALNEVKRILKPGGRMYILDVTADDFLIRWINRLVSAREKEHVKFYGSREYDDMFARAGLKHVSSRIFKGMYPMRVHVAEKNFAPRKYN